MLKKDKDIYHRGMVFGVFDGFHPGHEYFLSEAMKQCDELVVVVAQSEIVEQIKKHAPKYTFDERVVKIKSFNPALIVAPGDDSLGGWQVLKQYNPDIIFLGYDQQGISKELEKLNIPHTFIESHYPEKYKSSLL